MGVECCLKIDHEKSKYLRAIAVTRDGVIEGVELRLVGKAIFACLLAGPVSSGTSYGRGVGNFISYGQLQPRFLSNP